jgi:hypothetical protein
MSINVVIIVCIRYIKIGKLSKRFISWKNFIKGKSRAIRSRFASIIQRILIIIEQWFQKKRRIRIRSRRIRISWNRLQRGEQRKN